MQMPSKIDIGEISYRLSMGNGATVSTAQSKFDIQPALAIDHIVRQETRQT
jgi:hypothetical protein